MANNSHIRIIEESPIRNGLDTFRVSFKSIYEGRSLSYTSDALNHLTNTDIQNSTLDLLFALRNLSTTRLLPSKTSHGTLQNDLRKLISAAASKAFDSSCTPWLHKTSSFVNSSEYRQDVNRVLKSELGPLYIGLPDFRSIFFRGVSSLQSVSDTVFEKYTKGRNTLFTKGWKGWPKNANQEDILNYSTAERKLDIGFVSNANVEKDTPYQWS
ncbi:hypothetical protein N7530_009708 [Penicillium desertorum]|uniref:Uncharacterized protein n=1 Tax=Penicillium desertorum TaxID=1303715 RepID=A0A9W9WJK2_9EURO|nr:hypothetical protein N7530_009708 [Penicillium desertorum]